MGDTEALKGTFKDIAVIGTGAIGGYYGSRLHHAGYNVHFLLNSEYDYVKEHGLTVESYLGDFSIEKPQVYQNITDLPKCDLVLVATKTTINNQIFPLIAPVLYGKDDDRESSVQLMQNGFGYEEQLHQIYPDIKLFAGMCFICSYRKGPGHIVHADYGNLSLAQYTSDPSGVVKDDEDLQNLSALWKSAEINNNIFTNLTEGRIRKLVWNIPYNGLSVVSDCKTDVLATDPSLTVLVREIMSELIDASQAVGAPVEREFIDAMTSLTKGMKPYDPSMRLDYLAGRPMEIDALYTGFIDYAAKFNYDLKLAKFLKYELEYIQRRQG